MATQASALTHEALLQDKTAVITGAGRGIGLAIARTFANHGACSILVVRNRNQGKALVDEFARAGAKAEFGVADVTDAAQIASFTLSVTQRHERIDLLVNNAGIFMGEDRAVDDGEIDPLVLDKTLRVNLFGHVRVTSALLPLIPNGGRIINVSSTMGQFAGEQSAYGAAYSISKAALNKYTQFLAAALRDREIMVDAFHPGHVKTDMGGPHAAVEPETAAKTALYLASRAPSEKTGLFWQDCDVIEW